ncbi:MAG: hypothetical protein KAJ29_07005 [Alphaproteobacteria bacterium]|nr:hypothetical protein [Alphaproteobacteria bacterium]
MRENSFIEKLWSIPPKEKRKPSKFFWQAGNIEKSEWVHEPDYYIIYRVGHDLRYLSIISGIIVFSICCLYRYAGFFPNLIVYSKHEIFLELYAYLINFSGPLFLLSLVYYGLWFKKNIRFSEYNILRQDPEGEEKFEWHRLHFVPFFTIIFAVFLFRPGLISHFFEMKFPIDLFPYLDKTFFVMFFSLFVVVMHSVAAQMVFKTALMSLYTYYKKQAGDSDDR